MSLMAASPPALPQEPEPGQQTGGGERGVAGLDACDAQTPLGIPGSD